jgi:hypothetical protein
MPIQWDVLRALFQMHGGDEAKVAEFLRGYYGTPVGQEEMWRSGQRGDVEEFVRRLLAAYHQQEGG